MPLSIAAQAPKLNPYTAFKRGEVLSYRVHYGLIDAGEVNIEVTSENKNFASGPTYHLVGQGRTTGSFDWFYKVRDRYDSYIDEETLLPQFFMRRVNEDGYLINQDYLFQHEQKKVIVKRDGSDKPRNTANKPFDIPPFTQDILSAFYFARNVDLSQLKAGEIITVNTFFDEEIFPLHLKIIGKETIKTRAGKIRCLKIRPVIQKGRVFKDEEDLTIWISDDKNRIPVRLQADVLVGSIKMDLKEYRNLMHDLALVP
jgi:hypothetical protein